MQHAHGIVIGIDGGGTHTRVMVTDLTGRVLSYVEKGSASFHKDLQAKYNVHQAIREAVSYSGRELSHVCAIAAGIAGYDSESDLEWVEALTDLDGLMCPRWHVNDAVAAHYGALLAKPGIVVIAGTGSIILAVTEEGQCIRNYDFRHYAASAARFIAYDAVHECLAGQTDETDGVLIQSMLKHWDMRSIPQLLQLARTGFMDDKRERDKKFGQFAPAVTEAAWHGGAVARRVCNRAIHQIKVGIELVASSFTESAVSVAGIGSVINSPYFVKALGEQLLPASNKRYQLVQPRLAPVAGAVLYAMKQLNIAFQDKIVENLEESKHSQQT